ncbi:MAG TPA: DUF6084 family protein [Dehalococcoidia bacterium]|nr:DUF6084 family protein [Dehalococcoidia bacterium]
MLSDLSFEVLDAYAVRYAAAPTLAFRLRVVSNRRLRFHSIALKCQIRIEPQRRRYTAQEQRELFSLFSDASRWDDTLKPFLWTHVSTNVAGFEDETEFELLVPCSYDLEVAAGKYFHHMRDGAAPLLFLFSGMVFAERPSGGLNVEPLSWDCEATYTLSGSIWSEMMDHYFPSQGWLLLERGTLDELERFKAAQAAPTWDAALRGLLRHAGEGEAV